MLQRLVMLLTVLLLLDLEQLSVDGDPLILIVGNLEILLEQMCLLLELELIDVLLMLALDDEGVREHPE